MRSPTRFLLILALLAPCAGRVAHGQARAPRDPLPRGLSREVQREAIALFNSSALRARGRTAVDSGRTLAGDVAVLDGPIVVAGRVTGRVTAINADVLLRRGARIDGDLVVVGGEVLHLPANVPHSAEALEDSVLFDLFSPPSATTGVDAAGPATP